MAVYQLERGFGGGAKQAVTSADAANTDTIDTGLSSIEQAVAQTASANQAVVTGTSGGTVTIGLTDPTGSPVTTPETVKVVAYGE